MTTFIKTVAAVAAAMVYTAAAFAQSANDIPGPSPAHVTRIEVKPNTQTVNSTSSEGGSMEAQTSNLFRLEDLEDGTKTRELAQSDLNALHAVADWINTFVATPHKDLGRGGPVCPFVPGALERKTLWLAPERIGNRSMPDIVQLMNGYKKRLLDAQPIGGDDASYKVIIVVFTDLSADRAKVLFGDAVQRLAIPSYVEDGVLFGPFYEGNEGTAIYNSGFRPFQSPMPFLFVRYGVVSDWKFFLNNADWLKLWAHRFGESGAKALADELRRTNWRQPGR